MKTVFVKLFDHEKNVNEGLPGRALTKCKTRESLAGTALPSSKSGRALNIDLNT